MRTAPSPTGADPRQARWCATLACDSERGQVAALMELLDRHGAYIEEFTVFDDTRDHRFYVRCVMRFEGAATPIPSQLPARFEALCQRFAHAQGRLHDLARPTPVLLMVSKADHCLRDLLEIGRAHV